MYDKAIIDTLRTAETPLRMRDIVTKLAPNDTHAFSAIGMTLTKLTRAGQVKRAKADGRYWHYWLGSDEASTPNDVMEITVKFRVSNFGTEADAIQWCKDIGAEPSLLGYIRWLAAEEGLMGCVDDGYEIIAAEDTGEGRDTDVAELVQVAREDGQMTMSGLKRYGYGRQVSIQKPPSPELRNQLVQVIAQALRENTDRTKPPAEIWPAVIQATGLRRATWAALTPAQQSKVTSAAMKLARG
jgi:hypothetical protein